MHRSPPCPADESPRGHGSRPADPAAGRSTSRRLPNLSDDFGRLLDAGIDDWGGVSPVTLDHVNPERPWPALDRLASVTEDGGSPSLPGSPPTPSTSSTPTAGSIRGLQFAVLDRTDAEGLGAGRHLVLGRRGRPARAGSGHAFRGRRRRRGARRGPGGPGGG